MADGSMGNPARLKMPRQEETVDALGVFNPNEHGVAVVAPGDDQGALGVPGVTDIAAMPDPKLQKRKLGRPKKLTAEAKREKWREQYQQRKAKAQAKKGNGRDEETPQEVAARAQALANRASAPPAPALREPVMKPPPRQLNPRWQALVISLPDMSAQPMDTVEVAIIKAREQLERYAKEAQRLRMAAQDRTCQFCGKVVEDGRWYARECPVDPNGRLVHDWVWCSQPCHISWVVQNQGGGGAQPEQSHLNFKYR